MTFVKISIKEIMKLIKKKGYSPQVWKSNEYVFITVDGVITISIHKNEIIRISRSTNPSEYRYESIISEKKLMEVIKALPSYLWELKR